MFSTERAQREWTQQAPELSGYFESVQGLAFTRSVDFIKSLVAKHRSRRESLTDTDPDDIFNDYYLFWVLLSMLEEYATFWDLLLKAQFGNSWSSLQDIEDRLRILRRFGRTAGIQLLDRIEDQCCHLEKLYPYKWFMSIELSYDKLECGICGENMNSLACPHIRGELYRGVLAAGTVRRTQELHAVALVQNPRDKRCVVQYPDDGPQFRLVRYLGGLVRDGRMAPFGFAGVEEKRIEVTPAEQKVVGRNGPCPCGSGRKFKKCCLGKTRIEREHLDLIGHHEGFVKPDQLVRLDR